MARLLTYVADRDRCTFDSTLGNCGYDFDPLGFENYVDNANKNIEAQVEEVDISFDHVRQPTYISRNLPEEFRG